MTVPRAEHFEQLVRSFDTAMLVTHADGRLRARPLSIASVDADGDLWFATNVESAKAHELQVDRRVLVVMQNASQFVSIAGTAELVDDREVATALWSDAWRPWFPKGADDPELVLIRVQAADAEFWDLKGLRGFVYLFDAVRHAILGERAAEAPGDHYDTLRLRSDDEPSTPPQSPTLTGWLKSQLHFASRRAR